MNKMIVNDKEFEIIKLLGKGKNGYSYLVTDGKTNFVLKQIHHEFCDYYVFGNKLETELKDYERLKSIGIRIPEMLEVDIKNERILKEFINGDTILNLIINDEMKEDYLLQLQYMCKRLYKARTNIDYFPTNFIVQNNLLYYIDYECNEYMEQWNFENWGIKYWSKTKEFLEYVENYVK